MKRGSFTFQELVTHESGSQPAFASMATGDVSHEAAAPARRPRWVANLGALVLAVVGAAGWQSPAAAQSTGQRDVKVDVVPLSAEPFEFTYNSVAQPSTFKVGYRVTITNRGASTINNFFFQGTASATVSSAPTFSSVEGFASTNPCSGAVGGSTVACTIGTLTAGGSTSFNVYFNSPVEPSPVPMPAELAKFSGFLLFAEGSPTPTNSQQDWIAADAALGTPRAETVKSAVGQDGGEFFTGSGVANPNDRAATRLTVPRTDVATATRLAIDEKLAEDPNCNSFVACFDTVLNVKDADGKLRIYNADAPLTIVLRQDSENLKPSAKLNSILLSYTNDDGVEYPNLGTLPSCDLGATGQPVANANGVPCVVQCKIFKKTRDRSDSDWRPELAGDLQCTLLNRNNGTFRLR